MLTITLRVDGMDAAFLRLDDLETHLTNFRGLWPALRRIYQDVTEAAFESEGVTTQSGVWKKLAKSTNRDRVAHGYPPAHPILQRSGELRRAVVDARTTETNKSLGFKVENDYFIFHQSLEPRSKLPRRAPINMTKGDIEAFENEIIVYVTGNA